MIRIKYTSYPNVDVLHTDDYLANGVLVKGIIYPSIKVCGIFKREGNRYKKIETIEFNNIAHAKRTLRRWLILYGVNIEDDIRNKKYGV